MLPSLQFPSNVCEPSDELLAKNRSAFNVTAHVLKSTRNQECVFSLPDNTTKSSNIKDEMDMGKVRLPYLDFIIMHLSDIMRLMIELKNIGWTFYTWLTLS